MSLQIACLQGCLIILVAFVNSDISIVCHRRFVLLFQSAQHKKIKTITLNTFERYCYREQLAQLKQFKQQYATHTIQCNLKCNLIQFRQELFMLSFTTRDLCRHRNFLLFCTQPTPHSCPGSQLEYQSNHETNNQTIYFRPEKAHCQLLY